MALVKAQELLQLAMLATRSRGVLLDEIINEFGCSHRTAQRMTNALEAAFPVTEQRVDEDRRVRWVVSMHTVAPFLMPSAEELAALATAIAELEQAGMATEAATARQLERKVRALIPPQAGSRLAVDAETVIEALGHAVRPGPRPAVNSEIDAAISQALKGPFHMRIAYCRRNENQPSERIVAPHGLLMGVCRYLVACDAAKSGSHLRHYRVEEICVAEVLDESFELDAGFSIKKHAKLEFGSYETPDEYRDGICKFRPGAAQHARRFEFHPTQRVNDLDDGSLLARFRASGLLGMCWHLYAWGTAVEVIAPLALREMVEKRRRDDFVVLP